MGDDPYEKGGVQEGGHVFLLRGRSIVSCVGVLRFHVTLGVIPSFFLFLRTTDYRHRTPDSTKSKEKVNWVRS